MLNTHSSQNKLFVWSWLLLLLLGLVTVSGGKRVKIDEGSAACKACKRIVMSMNQSTPELRNVAGKTAGSNLNKGAFELKVQEEISRICTFSSIYYQKEILKQCEAIMEEHEEEFARLWVSYAKEPEEVNLLKSACWETARVCPRSVNSTQSEVIPPKEKYLSEREPPTQGAFRQVVAASWMKEVIEDEERDYVTLQHQGEGPVQRKLMAAVQEAAEIVEECPYLRVGKINLERNDIPPPYGDYIAGDSIAMWKAQDKRKPSFMQNANLASGEITTYDILNFILNGVQLATNFRCMAKISEKYSDKLSNLQHPKEEDEL